MSPNPQLERLRSEQTYLEDELRAMHEAAGEDAFDAETQARWDEGEAAVKDRQEQIAKLEARLSRIGEISQRPEHREAGDEPSAGPAVIRKADPREVAEDRSSSSVQRADAVTRSLEPLIEDPENLAHVRQVAKRHAGDFEWARNMILRTSDTYVSAWSKAVTGREMLLSDEERAALVVGTNTAGGFLVPSHLDPTLILTNNGSSNAIREISRVVTLTDGNVWNGVTSAGANFSWDPELTEVSDDTPAIARVSVPIYKAQGFIQASIEAFEDIPGLTSDVLALFADGRDRIEGTAHATGSGNGEPTGIFTALDANTNVELTSTTAATIGLVDLQTVYRSLPVRWRKRASWLMNPLYLLAIQALGTAVSASYSTDLTQPLTNRILGRPVVESDDAPSTQTTTVRDNEIVFGDFSNFLIVDKPGSFSVEFIPHLFNTANNLPDGRRGWYAHWRTGSDSINDLAFRLLQDKTSA